MRKILIIRFSSIGDIVLTTPVIRCLYEQVSPVEIHYLTKPQYQSLLSPNPYISKVHVLDQSVFAKALELKQQQYDLVIDLHNNLRTHLLTAILDVPVCRFDKMNFEKWIYVKTKENKFHIKHIVKRYLHTLSNLNVIDDGKGLDYFIPSETTLPEDLNKFVIERTSFAAIVIGANHATKRLSYEKLKEIMSSIDIPIVLVGGREDEALGEKLLGVNPQQIMNTCGKLTLNQSALLLSKSSKILTHDTGMMHIAAALQKDVISVWGNTVPEFGMTPYYGSVKKETENIFQVDGLSCRPCSKIGFDSCPQKHFDCMNRQNVSAIVSSINQ